MNIDEISTISHSFIAGVYAKQVKIPSGHHVLTHKHNFDHMSILAQGNAVVVCDGEAKSYHAPAVIEIKAGVNHEVIANTDCVWFCVHNLSTVEDHDMWHPDKIDVALIEHMQKQPFTVEVDGLNEKIKQHPELWNRYTIRTKLYKNSPHREVDDIWIRYRDISEFDPENPQAFAGEHLSMWYAAYYYLQPEIDSVLRSVMNNFPNSTLGGVLITRIPPGKQVYRHSDAGFWHSEYYKTKVLVLLESAPGQTFSFENKSYAGVKGEVFKFNNLVDHWVENNSDVDRVSLILAVREHD